jgi:hypothetical protein
MRTLKSLGLAVGTLFALSACAPGAPPPVDTAGDEAALKAATVTNASGATVDSGSYLSVSHKSNRKWLYYRDTYNSDRPMPAPPVAAEKK